MARKKKDTEIVPGWLIVGIIAALAAAVAGLAARNAKGNQRYDQLVSAINDLIEQGRARAENAAELLTDTGQELAKDVKSRAGKVKGRLG